MGKFKLPSFSYITQSALSSFLRFPLVICAAIFVAFVGIEMAESYTWSPNSENLLMTGILGVPLFFAIHTYLESTIKQTWKSALLIIGGFAALYLIYILLAHGTNNDRLQSSYIHYAIFSLAIHLAVSFAPFLSNKTNNGFWQFNRSLFVRLFIAQLYAMVIYGGICGALLAIQELFEVNIDEDLYFKLWIIHASVVNIWIFVGGIPDKIGDLENLNEYPKALKIFAQFILFPIVLVYFIILYAYIFKILILVDWPKGIVSYLIIGFSALAYLTSLLLYPYGKLENGGWVKKARRGIYIAIIPLTVILFIAIGMRISNYGITINRYIILLVGIWLLCISLYNAFKVEHIKSVPISLAIVSILASFGPWGASAVSERNQIKQLKNILIDINLFDVENEKMLQEYNHVTNEAIYPDTIDEKITVKQSKSVKSTLNYLEDFHGFDKINHWFVQDLDTLNDRNSNERYNYFNEGEAVRKVMGLAKFSTLTKSYYRKSFKINSKEGMDISDYDFLLLDSYRSYSKLGLQDNFKIGERDFKYFLDKNENLIEIKEEDEIILSIDLSDFIVSLENTSEYNNLNFSKDSLTIHAENEIIDLQIIFNAIDVRRYSKGEVRITSYQSTIMVRLKE